MGSAQCTYQHCLYKGLGVVDGGGAYPAGT